jgi:hypothetical protein
VLTGDDERSGVSALPGAGTAPDGHDQAPVLIGHLKHARHLLREMTGHLDIAGPLPSPTRWVRECEGDPLPGAVWQTGWRPRTRFAGQSLEVIAALEDAGSDLPVVFLRGLDGDEEITCMATEQAVTLGRALLAAAALAGSAQLRTHCQARQSPARSRRDRTC